jgi:hypothetical protein
MYYIYTSKKASYMKKLFGKSLILVAVFIVLCFISNRAEAQCAMCKAATETGGWSSKGLNTGILYLMIIPYIAFGALAYFWYKASKKQKEKQTRKSPSL